MSERTEGASGVAEAVLAALPDGCVIIDADLRVHYWNPAAARILGWDATEVLGRRDPSVPASSRNEALDALERIRQGGPPPSNVVVQRQRKDGSSVSLALRGGFSLPEPEDGLCVIFQEATLGERRLHQRNRLSRRLVDAIRIEEVSEVLGDAIRELLEAERAIVLSPCPNRLHLHGVRTLGGYQEDAEQLELDCDPGTPWMIAAAGRPTAGRLDLAGEEWDVLYVPMGPEEQGQVLAVVHAGTLADVTTASLARAVADEAWIALERAQLVGDLEGKVEILEATAAVASVAGLDLDRTLERVAAHAATALSCERAAIYLREPDGELHLATLYATDLDIETEEGARTAREVLERGDQILVQDTATCDFLDGPWHREIGAVAVFGLPLRVGSRDVGVLLVAHTDAHPRGFTTLCQQVGASVAQQAALAIEHARLYATEQANVRRLEELDQLKADYMAGITHDLKTPLTGLLGFTQTLNRLGDNLSTEQLRHYLGVMERQARLIIAMVEDLLLSARIEGGQALPGSREPVDLGSVLAASLELYTPAQRERLEVDFAPVSPVLADETQLRRVVHNLIDNALKYSPPDTAVDVWVCDEGEDVVFGVRDHGPGVPSSEREQIFERFRSGGAGHERGSTGLGLFISRSIARGHDGELEFCEPSGEGACFKLRLPRLGVEVRRHADDK